jgi:hypothetical protein
MIHRQDEEVAEAALLFMAVKFFKASQLAFGLPVVVRCFVSVDRAFSLAVTGFYCCCYGLCP